MKIEEVVELRQEEAAKHRFTLEVDGLTAGAFYVGLMALELRAYKERETKPLVGMTKIIEALEKCKSGEKSTILGMEINNEVSKMSHEERIEFIEESIVKKLKKEAMRETREKRFK